MVKYVTFSSYGFVPLLTALRRCLFSTAPAPTPSRPIAPSPPKKNLLPNQRAHPILAYAPLFGVHPYSVRPFSAPHLSVLAPSHPTFHVSTPEDKPWRQRRWTVTQKGLLLKCVLRGCSHNQCAA